MDQNTNTIYRALPRFSLYAFDARDEKPTSVTKYLPKSFKGFAFNTQKLDTKKKKKKILFHLTDQSLR